MQKEMKTHGFHFLPRKSLQAYLQKCHFDESSDSHVGIFPDRPAGQSRVCRGLLGASDWELMLEWI